MDLLCCYFMEVGIGVGVVGIFGGYVYVEFVNVGISMLDWYIGY